MITTKSIRGDLNIFDILVEKRNIGYLLLDSTMKILFIHKQMAFVLELDPEEVLNKCWYDVLPKMSRHKELYDAVLAGKDQDLVLYEMDFPEGRRYWEVDHLATAGDDGKIEGMLIMAHEVTERQRMSLKLQEQLEELKKSNEKLNRSKIAYVNLLEDIHEEKNHLMQLREDLEEKTKRLRKSNTELAQFAYIASHDLQEPLRTISNFSGLLKSDCARCLSEESKLYLGFVSEASERMGDLVSGLMDYSRIGGGSKKTKLNCNEILFQVIECQIKKYPLVHCDFNVEDLPEIVGFQEDIEMLFTQLIDNAMKFRSKDRSCEINVQVTEIKDFWKFCIVDNGIGIDAMFFEKIFLIYKRLHAREAYPGTGIGLSQCKKIVELQGGVIGVDSKLDIGSEFYFTIPK